MKEIYPIDDYRLHRTNLCSWSFVLLITQLLFFFFSCDDKYNYFDHKFVQEHFFFRIYNVELRHLSAWFFDFFSFFPCLITIAFLCLACYRSTTIQRRLHRCPINRTLLTHLFIASSYTHFLSSSSSFF